MHNSIFLFPVSLARLFPFLLSLHAAYVCLFYSKWVIQCWKITTYPHHYLYPFPSLFHSCEGARLPALSSQSSRLLAVECWEYPERKGKWHHSGDLPYQATLPGAGWELPNKHTHTHTPENQTHIHSETVIDTLQFAFQEKRKREEKLWASWREGER